MNPVGDRQGLGYVKSDNYDTSSSKTTFVPAFNKSSNIANPKPKGKGVLGQRTSRTRRTTILKNQYQQSHGSELQLIPTCHNYAVLGHIKPRCHKLENKSRSKDIPSQVNFLSNQVSYLTIMLTKLTRITSTSKKVWVKKSDLTRCDEKLNCYVAYIVLKTQNNSMWYLDSASLRHMWT